MTKYIVSVEYTIRRTLVVHSANEKVAAEKAKRIVASWHDKAEASILSVKEAINDQQE